VKKNHTIFFALPFDNLTKNRYENICKNLRTLFEKKGYKLITLIGKDQIGPSSDYVDVSAFKAQNTELHKQFTMNIAKADILVADLTNNNPNVHLELGIALALNKNILRVTGRPVKELGFDIQSLEVYAYANENDLLDKIANYLDSFIKIKELPFSLEYEKLYQKLLKPVILPGTPEEVAKERQWTIPINNFSFRDGAIKTEFEFLDSQNDNSWIGVYFRAASTVNLGSCLLYIRKNGSIELAVINPWINQLLNVIYKKQLNLRIELNKRFQLLIEIENDELEVKVGNEIIRIPGLEFQAFGRVLFATYESRCKFENIEMINRDSIDVFF
jgi:hypothetical protein